MCKSGYPRLERAQTSLSIVTFIGYLDKNTRRIQQSLRVIQQFQGKDSLHLMLALFFRIGLPPTYEGVEEWVAN